MYPRRSMSGTVACFIVSDHGREMDIAWTNTGDDVLATHVVMYDSTSVLIQWLKELQSMIQATEIHLFGWTPRPWVDCIKQLDHDIRIIVQDTSILDESDVQSAVHALKFVVQGIAELPVSRRHMEGCLMVDRVSLCAMGIMPGSKEGEGFSIFEICRGNCMTVQGKKRMKELFLFPLKTREARTQRLDQIESLCKNRHCFAGAQKLIKKVGNPLDVLQKMWKTQSLPNPRSHARDFTKLKESLVCLLELTAYFKSNFNEKRKYFIVDSTDAEEQLHHASCLIDKVIDPGQVQEGMCIHYGISEELDNMKAAYFGTRDLMRHLTVFQREKLPKVLRHGTYQWEMVHIAQVGVFMHCPEGIVPSYIYDCLPDWELAFEPGALGSSMYQGALYSTEVSNEVHRRIDNVFPRICDLEAAMCNKLIRRLLEIEQVIADAMQSVAHIDCLLSLAKLTVEHNFHRPEYSDAHDEFLVKSGWNPFVGKQTWNCIANDTEVSMNERIHVITGPLNSGKTSYLQQISVISFLGHIGCFVPAERAIIPQMDRIFIKMGTEESLSDSSFSQSVRRLSDMMNLCSSKSLIVIDEFGKETLSCDGISLRSAVIQYFAQCHEGNPPIVFFVTHMGEFLQESLSQEAINQCQMLRMETVIHRNTNSGRNPSHISLYKVNKKRNVDCTSGSLFAHESISAEVACRGGSILELINSGGILRRNDRYSTLRAIKMVNAIKKMQSQADALAILNMGNM